MSTVTVPDTARKVEGGDDFTELAAVLEQHAGPPLLASFSFAQIRLHGVELLEVYLPRGLRIRPAGRTSGPAQVLAFTEPGPVPPVWVWSLSDERAAEETT